MTDDALVAGPVSKAHVTNGWCTGRPDAPASRRAICSLSAGTDFWSADSKIQAKTRQRSAEREMELQTGVICPGVISVIIA